MTGVFESLQAAIIARLTAGRPDRAAELQSLLDALPDHERGELTSRQFVRYYLMQLKLCEDLTHVRRAGQRPIASVEEVLAVRPELGPSV